MERADILSMYYDSYVGTDNMLMCIHKAYLMLIMEFDLVCEHVKSFCPQNMAHRKSCWKLQILNLQVNQTDVS
jgi:hypothetical protein